MKTTILWSIILTVGIVFNSCTKEEMIIPKKPNPVGVDKMSISNIGQTVNLIAGQHINVGSIHVSNDNSNIFIKFTTTGEWYLQKTHLFVGKHSQLPLNRAGNPQIGQYPYQTQHSPIVQEFIYTLPIELFESTVTISAHAEVVKMNSSNSIIQSETAWGQGTRISNKSWAMYFTYTIITNHQEMCYNNETAWSSGERYVSQGNWATYSSYDGIPKTVNIYAGQFNLAGNVSFSAPDYNDMIQITISLQNGWILQDVSEGVKIQGYSVQPSSNPAPGSFETYKGNLLSIKVPNYKYYGIHLDVRKLEECIQ
jgi:hypothetical protein